MVIIDEDKINNYFKYVDFWKEFDNLDYNSDFYEYDYGSGKKKYKNYIVVISVNIIHNLKNFVLNDVRYVVAIDQTKKTNIYKELN